MMSDEQTEITKYMSEEECWCEETVEEYEKMCMPCRIKHEREQHLATIERLTAERDELQAEVREMCQQALAADAQFRDLQAERDAAVEREGRLREDLDTAHTVALKAPELNPSNYDHDQVCELNTAMCEVFSILDGLLKENSNG